MRKDYPCERQCYGCKYLKLGHICTKEGTCAYEIRDTVIAIILITVILILAYFLERGVI